MAAKKSAKKAVAKKVAATKAPAKKAAVKKTTVKKTAVKVAAAKKAVQKSPPPFDAVARAAYLNYRRRIEQGLPGDHDSDWLEAERSFME